MSVKEGKTLMEKSDNKKRKRRENKNDNNNKETNIQISVVFFLLLYESFEIDH